MAFVDVNSPMAGFIKQVLVATGDTVEKGQELLIIESMKMEIPVESTDSGTVADVVAVVGTSADEGQLLLRLEV